MDTYRHTYIYTILYIHTIGQEMWFGLGDTKRACVCVCVCWVELFAARSDVSFFFVWSLYDEKNQTKTWEILFRDFYMAGSREHSDSF